MAKTATKYGEVEIIHGTAIIPDYWQVSKARARLIGDLSESITELESELVQCDQMIRENIDYQPLAAAQAAAMQRYTRELIRLKRRMRTSLISIVDGKDIE